MEVDGTHMKKSNLKLLVSITIIAFFSWVFMFSSTKPRILVLQSLSENADWGLRIEQGMKDILRGNRAPVTVVYHYMNLDESGSEAQVKAAVQSALRSIQRENPDILISIDDESNTLVTSKLNPDTRPAVLYLSTLQPPSSYGYSKSTRSTGIEENVPVQAITDLLSAIHPGRHLKIAVIGVDNVTGQAEVQRIKSKDWGPHTLGPIQLANTFKQWRKFVVEEAGNADVLIVLTAEMIEGDTQGVLIPESDVIRWTEQHAEPLPIGIRHSFVRYGGGLAISSPGSVYGQLGMQMALDWIKNGLSHVPAAKSDVSDFNVSIRDAALEKRGINLPMVYRELARASGGLYP